MPLSPPSIVNVAAPSAGLPAARQILWPTAPGYGDGSKSDSSSFPSLSAVKARCTARYPQALSAFIDAVNGAQHRILVLDDFLFKPLNGRSLQDRCDQIRNWLHIGLVANDIRFLTNAHGNKMERDDIQKQFNEHVENINRNAPRRSGTATIEIRFSLNASFPYVHDRFAIVDNELWHFGATVGGLHNLVNAATRGWNADEHGAVRFFELAWRGDGDILYGK